MSLPSIPTIPSLGSLVGKSPGASFFSRLQKASYGGVQFGVLSGEARFGRRQAIHEYPFRDKPWVEDLGKATRRISVTGFLVENDVITNGGAVIAQRDKLIGVAESAGTKTLIHPTLGALEVSLLEIAVSEKWDQGRYFEIQFTFIESGKKIFPSIEVSTGAAVQGSALLAALAAASDFAFGVVGLIHQAEALIQTAIRTVNMWIAIAKNVVNDATNLFGMLAALVPGSASYGRYFGGASTGFMASARPSAGQSAANSSQNSASSAAGQPASIAALINAGSVSRANVAQAAAVLSAAVAAGDSAGTAVAAQALSDAVLAAMVDPADGVRLMAQLAAFSPSVFATSSVIGLAQSAMQTAMSNLFRRSAVITLAKASATYQPSSANDAVAVRNGVTALLDNEIEIAGDSGEDATYGALRALRQVVVADLNTRGAALPALATFTFHASIPAATLSLRLYRDASRADEIASETNAPHPAFQPRTIQVLAV